MLGRHRCYRLTPRCWDTLTEEWWQWAYSLPYTAHPLFDTADASAGQHGKVWFLGGNFTGAADTRTAVIPRGKFLFFPILNTMMDDTDCSGSGRTVDPYNSKVVRATTGSLFHVPVSLGGELAIGRGLLCLERVGLGLEGGLLLSPGGEVLGGRVPCGLEGKRRGGRLE